MKNLGLRLAGVGLVLVGCASDGMNGVNGSSGTNGTNGSNGTNGTNGADGAPGPELALPALYTQTNAASGNRVTAYLRASNGNLSREGTFATMGMGTDAGLGSQGALAFDAKSQRFFTVNAGDNTISMLALDTDGVLTAMSTVSSGGVRPVSVTIHAGTVYVVNQGDFPEAGTATPANISGFRVDGDKLTAIAGSTRALSGTGNVHPTDIAFTPDGKFLVVAEEVGNKLDTFKVVAGAAQAGNFQDSAGPNPFAFDFSPDGFLIVAEVGGGAANASTVSSYQIMDDGNLSAITEALPTLQSAACWIVMAGDFGYIANTGSGNLTAVNVSQTGEVSLHEASGIVAVTGAGPIDVAVAPDHGLLYSLAGGGIHVFAIHPDGSLDAMGTLPGLPASTSGLVAR